MHAILAKPQLKPAPHTGDADVACAQLHWQDFAARLLRDILAFVSSCTIYPLFFNFFLRPLLLSSSFSSVCVLDDQTQH